MKQESWVNESNEAAFIEYVCGFDKGAMFVNEENTIDDYTDITAFLDGLLEFDAYQFVQGFCNAVNSSDTKLYNLLSDGEVVWIQ